MRRAIRSHWRLGWAVALIAFAGLASAQTPTPSVTPTSTGGPTLSPSPSPTAPVDCGTPYPAKTPYPVLTPPAAPEDSRNLNSSGGTTWMVATCDELKAAAAAAAEGDHIVLTQDVECTVQEVQTQSLWFEGAPGGRKNWTGAPATEASARGGQPAFYGAPVAFGSLVFKNLNLRGSDGYSLGELGQTGKKGGNGGHAVVVPSVDVTIDFINCSVTGGNGGAGEPNTNCGGPAPLKGGDGGSGGTSNNNPGQAFADLQTTFAGGSGGAAPGPVDIGCCVAGGVPGYAASAHGPLWWVQYVEVTPTVSPTPPPTLTPTSSATPTPSRTPSPTPTEMPPSPSPTDTPDGPTPTPDPTGCLVEEPFSPAPTAYPPVTPPPTPAGIRELGTPTGTIHTAANASELDAAIDAAVAGDRIVISADIFASVVLTKSGLWFEGTDGSQKVLWRGISGVVPSQQGTPNGDGAPALTVAPGVEVALSNLALTGGSGGSAGQLGVFGHDGGNGGRAVAVGEGSAVSIIGCTLTGGQGGPGEALDYCEGPEGKSGDGGNGTYAWQGPGALYADLQSLFKGGQGGYALGSYTGFDDCCIHAGGAGASAIAYGPTQWVEFTAPSGPFENAAARAVGDFDGSGCVDLADFLLLLDAWQTSVGGSVVGMTDFLALLDNWQTGAGC